MRSPSSDLTTDPGVAGFLHSRLGYQLWVAGRNEEAQAEHREAVRIVPAEPPTPERAHVLVGLAGWLMGAGRYGESRDLLDEAIASAVATGATKAEVRARIILGADLVSLGLPDEGIEQELLAQRLSEEHDLLESLVAASGNLSYHLIVGDRFDEAVEAARAGSEAIRTHGLERRFGPHFDAALLDALFRAGRWAEAIEVAEASLERHAGGLGTIYRDTAVARLFGGLGRAEAARERLLPVETLTDPDIDVDLAAFAGLAWAELSIDAGQPDEAIAAVDVGAERLAGSDDTVLVGPLAATGLRAVADRAERARALRRPADAAAAEAAGERMRERVEALRAAGTPTTASGRAILALCDAEAGRLAERTDAAAWTAVADAWAAIPMPYPAAYARSRAAEAALVAGDREGATVALTDARTTAAALGAMPLLGWIDGLAGRGRLSIAAAAEPAAADAAAVPAGTPIPAKDGPAGRPRPLDPRARGPRPRRRGTDERADRPGTVHQPEDRERARHPHPRQAGRQQPHRGGDDRRPRRAGGRRHGRARRVVPPGSCRARGSRLGRSVDLSGYVLDVKICTMILPSASGVLTRISSTHRPFAVIDWTNARNAPGVSSRRAYDTSTTRAS